MTDIERAEAAWLAWQNGDRGWSPDYKTRERAAMIAGYTAALADTASLRGEVVRLRSALERIKSALDFSRGQHWFTVRSEDEYNLLRHTMVAIYESLAALAASPLSAALASVVEAAVNRRMTNNRYVAALIAKASPGGVASLFVAYDEACTRESAAVDRLVALEGEQDG